MQVSCTPAALEVVEQVKQARPGASLVFVFGAGCCEGTAPHLFTNHYVGPTHAEVGRAGSVPIFADAQILRLYAGRHLRIDVEADPAADGFSAEVELGYRFVLRTSGAPA